MKELKYLEMYESENTVKAYKQALDVFLSGIYGDGDLEDLASRYMSESRDHETDIQQFLSKINGRPPKTKRLYISAVRTFLIENNIELTKKFWRHLNRKIKGNRARTLDKVPSNVELRRIIMHMPVHGKALFLTLASSGMRIGEALQLDLSDIDLNSDPPRISIRGEYTKSGDPRVAFISSEAKEHILEWLKYRSEYLKTASRRSIQYDENEKEIIRKSTEDTRLFPFTSSTVYFIWNTALDKTKLNHRDKSTRRHKLHPHVLRKFFRTKMGAVMKLDIVEALMGHEGYLTDVYRRYDENQLADFYKQSESAVMVFGKVEESLEIKQDVTKLERRIVDLNRKIEEQNRTIEDLSRLMEDKVKEITRKLFEKWMKEGKEELKEARRDFTERFKESVKE